VRADINGDEATVTLRTDLRTQGDTKPYRRPGDPHDDRDPRRDAYFILQATIFSDGWVAALSANALTVLLAFRYLHQTRGPATANVQGLFISEALRKERFGFSESTYYAGSLELERFGVVKSWRQHVQGLPAPGPVKVRRVFAFEHGFTEGFVLPDSSEGYSEPF
jgi:hypothetical protein